MNTQRRQSNDEFIALRALGREPWQLGTAIWWRHYGTWCRLYPDGHMRAVDGRSWSGRDDLLERAECSAYSLKVQGLAELLNRQCCPNPECERNSIFDLTAR